ncbi:MAG: hypothetical protein U1E10_16365 [Bdellovibrionales bacterium]|jgi:hypothetical protein|nr:hypothetical protein [Bdellovibrionales bacterium]
MSTSVRMIGVILIASFACIGLLSVFEVIPTDALPKAGGQLALGAAALVGAVLAFKLVSTGKPNVNDTEPPPQL